MAEYNSKVINTTAREQAIIEKATTFRLCVPRLRLNANVENYQAGKAALEEACERTKMPGLVYAIAEMQGMDTQALMATYTPGKGWKELH